MKYKLSTEQSAKLIKDLFKVQCLDVDNMDELDSTPFTNHTKNVWDTVYKPKYKLDLKMTYYRTFNCYIIGEPKDITLFLMSI